MAKPKKQKPVPYYLLMGVSLLLLLFGLVMIASASSVVAYLEFKNSFHYVWRQLIYIVIGFAAMFGLSRANRQWLRKLSPLALLASVIFLTLVVGYGRVAGGARSWLEVGGLTIQPSEFAKLALVLYGADRLSRRRENPDRLASVAKSVGIPAMIVFGLIMLQPDMGTGLIIVMTMFSLLFLAGIRFRDMAVMFSGAAVIVGPLIMATPYMRERIFAFLNPWADQRGSGFQLMQSLLAFGSGGIGGVGLGLSRQKFGYLPAPYTDFILAIIGEELGLWGSLAIVVLFLALSLIILGIVRKCDDQFCRLVGSGIGIMLIGQALINMGGATGLLPITGVPLPLVSYGGSSLIVTMASIGILLNLTLPEKSRKKRGAKNEDNDMRRGNGRTRLSRPGAGRSA